MDIRCTTKHRSGRRRPTLVYATVSRGAAAMTDPNEIVLALSDALPPDATRFDEIVATGMLMTALIIGVVEEERAALVEQVCDTLRKSVANELN